MKKVTRILSVALVAVMVLSMSAVSLAETPSVFIPKKLSKLVDAFLEDYTYPTLKTKTTDLAPKYDAAGRPVMSTTCKDAYTGDYVQVRSITEDSVMQFQFSEKPDWFGCSVSTLDYPGGWASVDIDNSGYGELEVGELHRQPGTWWATGDWYDADKKRHVWTATGGDNIFKAGKDYGNYSVEVTYRRDGTAEKVVVTLKDSEDVFRTGQEGAEVSITFALTSVVSYSANKYTGKDEKHTNTYFYVAGVSAKYPEGNAIAAVETEWRNTAKPELASYRISYAVSENEVYKITYAPATATVLQETYKNEKGDLVSEYYPAQGSYNYYPSKIIEKDKTTGEGSYLTHYTADEPLCGEYYRNGNLVAVSGSGNNIRKWYAPGHGKRVNGVKKNIYSFKSPRVY